MLYYLVILISAFSGAIAFSSLDKENKWFSLRMLWGFILPVFFIYLGNVLFSFSLAGLATTYFFGIFALMAMSLILNRKSQPPISVLTHALKHPALVLPLIALIILLFNDFPKFYPHAWDEFSHWVTMPKQMFAFDQLTSHSFPYLTFITYTPGWPITLIYPMLVLKALIGQGWSTQPLIYSSFFFGLLSLSVIFDFFNSFYAQIKNEFIIPIGWLAVFALLPAIFPLLFKTTVLIENPQTFVLIILFTTFLMSFDGVLKKRFSVFLMSAFLCYGYLLKDSSLVMALPILAFMVSSKKFQLKDLLFVFAPTILAALFWQFKTAEFEPIFVLLSDRSFSEIWSERSMILGKMFVAFAKLFHGKYLLLFPMAALCYFLSRTARLTLRLFGLYVVCTFVGLYWLYMNSFRDFEALGLAAFPRYFEPILNSAGVLLSIMVIKLAFDRLNNKIIGKKFRTFCTCVFIALACSFFFITMERTFIANLENRTKDSIAAEGEKLALHLIERGLKSPLVYIIAQGSDQNEYYKGMYSSLVNDQVAYRLQFALSWSESPDKMWTEKAEKAELIERLLQAGALWIVKTDPWMEDVLSKIVKGGRCPGSFNEYFLIKDPGSMDFECVSKQ